MLEAVAVEVAKATPFDASLWLGVDPATLLPTAPGRITGIESSGCSPYWSREFQVQDANLFRDLARLPVPVATLRTATDDQPVRSARYREFMEPQGFDDELRAVFRSGDNAWGVLGLYREKNRPPFDADDVAFINAISAPLANRLRTYVAAAAPWLATSAAPGLLMFTPDATLVSSNAEATGWLEQLSTFRGHSGEASPSSDWIRSLGEPGVPDICVPPALIALIARAQAVAAGHERGPARLRLRSRGGRWLVLHASCLEGVAGSMVAVMIEPAKSAEIAPIIIEAYALTTRERDVVRGIAQGLSTAEIASEVFLSPHTVRDYVKSVFDKVGVSSRGELVAKLFAEHYYDALHAGVGHGD